MSSLVKQTNTIPDDLRINVLTENLLNAYGSFFGLTNPISKFLILFCSLLNLPAGLVGLCGGFSVLICRQLLLSKSYNNLLSKQIETINGILFGLLLGSLFHFDFSISSFVKLFSLLGIGSVLIVVFSSLLRSSSTKNIQLTNRSGSLPILGLPYCLVAYIALTIIPFLGLSSNTAMPTLINWHIYLGEFSFGQFIRPLGAIYFNGSEFGGLLVFCAFLISSRYLASIALISSVISFYFLSLLGLDPNSLLFLIAQMNAVLTACVIGSLYAVPGKKSLALALISALFAALLSLTFTRLFAFAALPILALPFVFSTYLTLLAFSRLKDKTWTDFWLDQPALAESSMAYLEQGKQRGIDSRSIALNLPVSGTWQIYQGFFGKHTHQSPWEYSLDFIQTIDGKSFTHDGSQTSDYHCFGKTIVSPVYGKVVDSRADLPDNNPGQMDCTNSWGNYLLIEIAKDAYVLLAHLKQGSVNTTIGRQVVSGQSLAQCGNSGRSPQPHLHMHVQNSPTMGSQTLPFHLSDLLVSTRGGDDYSLNLRPSEETIIKTCSRNAPLKKAMQYHAGRWFEYEVSMPTKEDFIVRFEIVVDFHGQLSIQSSTKASSALVINEQLLAFYGRNDQSDPVLDALILSLNLTPFVEGNFNYADASQRKLMNSFTAGSRGKELFARWLIPYFSPFSYCLKSNYKRSWDSHSQLWIQYGEHKLFDNAPADMTCSTIARLCESNGLVNFTLEKQGNILVAAKLVSYGIKGDLGIPATKIYENRK